MRQEANPVGGEDFLWMMHSPSLRHFTSSAWTSKEPYVSGNAGACYLQTIAVQHPYVQYSTVLCMSVAKMDKCVSWILPFTFCSSGLAVQERSAALADALPQLPCESAWRLYSAVPSLLTLLTLEVAHKLRAMARATGMQQPTIHVNGLSLEARPPPALQYWC